MCVEAIIIGIIVGLIRGGRISYLSNLNLKQLNIFVLGVVIQLLPFFFGKIDFFQSWACQIYFVGYLLVFVFLILNFAKKGMKLLIAGTALNSLALLLNDLKMPVYVNSTSSKVARMNLSIRTGDLVNYVPVKELNGFTDYLGKIIHMPDFYLGVPVISVADIIISVGIIILIQDAMVSKKGFFV